jgi:UDP-glucose 4-epimerase
MQKLEGQKVLVTGSSGFIGTHLCRRLCKMNAEVFAISRSPSEMPGLKWTQGDITDLEDVQKYVREVRPDVIFHVASLVSGSRNLDAVLPTLQGNLVSAVNLLTLAVELGCDRIVLTGSREEPDQHEIDPIPCSPYAAAKWAASGYARMFHSLYQLPVTVVRPTMVYGPEQRDVKKLIPYVICSLLKGEAPQLSGGTRPMDWIYIDDIVDGFLAAAQVPGIEGGTFDLGSGTLITVRETVEQLVELVNPKLMPAFGAVAERPMERTHQVDLAHSTEKLGWKPIVPLSEGLQKTIEWYRSQMGS